jgi:hypothetical protein
VISGSDTPAGMTGPWSLRIGVDHHTEPSAHRTRPATLPAITLQNHLFLAPGLSPRLRIHFLARIIHI